MKYCCGWFCFLVNTFKSLTVHVGGTVINTFVGSPGFIFEDDCFPLHMSLSVEFETANPLAGTVKKFDLVGKSE